MNQLNGCYKNKKDGKRLKGNHLSSRWIRKKRWTNFGNTQSRWNHKKMSKLITQ